SDGCAHALRPPANLFGRYPQHAQRRDLVVALEAVRSQRFRQGRIGQLVDAQRAEQRIAANALDQVPTPSDDPRLRPAQEFVAAEADEIDALRQARGDSRLRLDAGLRQVVEATAAQV